MRYYTKIYLFFFCFAVFQANSQDKNVYFRLQDSTNNIPNLAVRGNVGLIVLSAYTSAWTLGYTGHRYFINDKPHFNSKQLKPYFLQLNDEVANNNYKFFENSKKSAIICGGIGLGLYFTALATAISPTSPSAMSSSSNNPNNRTIVGLLLIGTGFIISAPIMKLRGISKLKIAINRHNSFKKF